jgi:RNA polymerase sigma-70 factor (ECF subfamily)
MGRYEIREHTDFCFTCISKTLPIEQQLAIMLKDIYYFSRKEIGQIMDETVGVVKHLLHEGRKTMSEIFDNRCALINKNGACHQCTELAGIYNPKQARRQELMKIAMVEKAEENETDAEKLYDLRTELVSFIDPLCSSGADLQDIIMQCTRKANGEIDSVNA